MTPLTPARAETMDVDGLAVVRRRRPDVDPLSPTIVFVHGAMDRAASFGRAMRRLADLDVVAFDRRGYAGSTDAGVATSISEHAADLRRVIEWSGAARAVVVGHSLGGTIALELASQGDDRLVSVGAFESPAPALDDSFDQVGGGAVELGSADGPAAAAEFFYRLMVGDDTWERLRERDRAARLAEGPALLAELIDLRDPANAVDLDAVLVPVMVGAGGLSRASLRGTAAALRERLPDAWMLEIAEAGHGAHLSHPDEFARYVRSVVARAPVFDDRPLEPR